MKVIAPAARLRGMLTVDFAATSNVHGWAAFGWDHAKASQQLNLDVAAKSPHSSWVACCFECSTCGRGSSVPQQCMLAHCACNYMWQSRGSACCCKESRFHCCWQAHPPGVHARFGTQVVPVEKQSQVPKPPLDELFPRKVRAGSASAKLS
eukprot:1155224-Pelagomonas_calceolata.AAC.9